MTDLERAKEVFLDFMAEAAWEVQADGDIDSNGRWVDCTTHKIVVTNLSLTILADALGIYQSVAETIEQAIQREINAPQPEEPKLNDPGNPVDWQWTGGE